MFSISPDLQSGDISMVLHTTYVCTGTCSMRSAWTNSFDSTLSQDSNAKRFRYKTVSCIYPNFVNWKWKKLYLLSCPFPALLSPPLSISLSATLFVCWRDLLLFCFFIRSLFVSWFVAHAQHSHSPSLDSDSTQIRIGRFAQYFCHVWETERQDITILCKIMLSINLYILIEGTVVAWFCLVVRSMQWVEVLNGVGRDISCHKTGLFSPSKCETGFCALSNDLQSQEIIERNQLKCIPRKTGSLNMVYHRFKRSFELSIPYRIGELALILSTYFITYFLKTRIRS